MSSSDLIRWGARGAVLAAVAWTVSGIFAFLLVQPQQAIWAQQARCLGT